MPLFENSKLQQASDALSDRDKLSEDELFQLELNLVKAAEKSGEVNLSNDDIQKLYDGVYRTKTVAEIKFSSKQQKAYIDIDGKRTEFDMADPKALGEIFIAEFAKNLLM